jgi:hypothetical protein
MGNVESFKKEFGLIVVGAVIFTASFLWKDTLSDIQEVFFPKYKGLAARILYTLIVSIVLVCAALHLRFLFGLNSTSSVQSPMQFDDSPIGDHNNNVLHDIDSSSAPDS